MPGDRFKSFLPGLVVLALGLAGIAWLHLADRRDRHERANRDAPVVEDDPGSRHPADPREHAGTETGSAAEASATGSPAGSAGSSLRPPRSRREPGASGGGPERSADPGNARAEASSIASLPASRRPDRAEPLEGTARSGVRSAETRRQPSAGHAVVTGSGDPVPRGGARPATAPPGVSTETPIGSRDPAGGLPPLAAAGTPPEPSGSGSTTGDDRVAVVRMIPSAFLVSVDDRLSVIVAISGASDVGHVPFRLVYDPGVLRFEYGEEGTFLGSDGSQTAFFATATSAGDAVVVGLSRLGRIQGVSGAGELCVLHFTVIGSGETSLGFAGARVRDSDNRILDAIFESTALSAT